MNHNSNVTPTTTSRSDGKSPTNGNSSHVKKEEHTTTTTSCTAPSSSAELTPPKLFQNRPLWQRFLLTVNVTMCVPAYSMLLWFGVYLGLLQLFGGRYLWFRTLWCLYLFYCVLDRTPTIPCAKRWWISESSRRWMRSTCFFRWVALYFPVTLIKTQDLDPNYKYLFLYHPHGVIGMGTNAALNTNGTNFEQLFPGIRRASVTLNACFWAPIFREWMLGNGFISANKSTILQTLRHESVVLVPGGAAEALHAHAGVFKLYLTKRKGFCRLALEASSPLVPCIAFGENEAFSTYYPQAPPKVDAAVVSSSSSTKPQQHVSLSNIIWKIQQRLVKVLTFSTPILLSPIPRPHPIHVVVGAPVSPHGTVDELHERYVQAVRSLYEQHQNQYGFQNVPLEII